MNQKLAQNVFMPTVLTIVFALASCSGGAINTRGSERQEANINPQQDDNQNDNSETNNPDEDLDLGQSLRKFSPVLALRQPSCLSCHAKIDGDFITDFMVGTNTFFGSKNNSQSYNNRFSGIAGLGHDPFSSININGRLVIPKADIENQDVLTFLGAGALSIKKALTTSVNFPYFKSDGATVASIKTGPIIKSIGEGRDKNAPGVNSIVEATKIVIDVPNERELEGVFAASAKVMVEGDSSIFVKKTSDENKVSGFRVLQGTVSRYISNETDTECIGDVFIRGTLFLRNLRLATNNDGCRLYVIGSVFIQGQITYTKDKTKSHLQIVSSRPIFSGIKDVGNRGASLDGYNRFYSLPIVTNEAINLGSSLQEDSGPYYIMWDTDIQNPFAVLYDSSANFTEGGTVSANSGGWQSINGQSLVGLQCSFNNDAAPGENDLPLNGKTCAVGRNLEFQRRHLEFNHVLFVTPSYQHRYLGKFTGTVIAETAIFTLGSLNFNHDPIFSNVPILPALKKEFLSVTE